MAISERLKAFLTTSRVAYTVTKHPVVYTAQEIAAAQHVSGRKLAKCVLITTDRGATLAVLPAIHLIDVRKLKILLGASKVSIAKEADIKERFPDVEVGAMSPFGNLYNVPVVAEKSLGDSEDIVFNAGSHTETIAMRHRDFVSLVKPKIGTFGQAIGGPAKGRKAGAKRSVRRGVRPKAQGRSRATKKASPSRPRSAAKRRR